MAEKISLVSSGRYFEKNPYFSAFLFCSGAPPSFPTAFLFFNCPPFFFWNVPYFYGAFRSTAPPRNPWISIHESSQEKYLVGLQSQLNQCFQHVPCKSQMLCFCLDLSLLPSLTTSHSCCFGYYEIQSCQHHKRQPIATVRKEVLRKRLRWCCARCTKIDIRKAPRRVPFLNIYYLFL